MQNDSKAVLVFNSLWSTNKYKQAKLYIVDSTIENKIDYIYVAIAI